MKNPQLVKSTFYWVFRTSDMVGLEMLLIILIAVFVLMTCSVCFDQIHETTKFTSFKGNGFNLIRL